MAHLLNLFIRVDRVIHWKLMISRAYTNEIKSFEILMRTILLIIQMLTLAEDKLEKWWIVGYMTIFLLKSLKEYQNYH